MGIGILGIFAFFLIFFYNASHLDFGWAGILLLFVLTGYYFTDQLVRKKASIGEFYKSLFSRVLIPYFIFLFLILFALKMFIESTLTTKEVDNLWEQFIFALTLRANLFPIQSTATPTHILDNLWVVSIGVQVLILWPLLFHFTPTYRYKQLLLSIIAAGPLIRLLCSFLLRFNLINTNLSPSLFISLIPFSYIDAFALGGYASIGIFPKVKFQLCLCLFLIPTLGLLIDWITGNGLISASSLGYGFPLANGLKQVWGYTLLSYLFTLLTYAVSRIDFPKILGNSPMHQHLGQIAFPLYLYHFPVLWFSRFEIDVTAMDIYALGIALILTIVISLNVQYMLNCPIRQKFEQTFQAKIV